MFDVFTLPFVQRGLVEVLLLAVAAGLVGTWVVLRGLAFFAHAVGTAAFPGLVLADGLGFAAPLGALAAALLFALLLGAGRREGSDVLTGMVLVGALAAGVLLASDVFHSGSNVESLLFGSLLLVGWSDVWIAGGVAVVAAVASAVLGRRWVAAGFDPESAGRLGVPPRVLDLALLFLVAITAVAALSVIGALLATALLVVPAATTRLWSRDLRRWQAATILLAAVEGTAGLWLSVETNAPPGATIAVLAGAVFALAALARLVPRRRLAIAGAAAALAVAALVASGCGSGATGGAGLDVVATTTQVADFARAVGGKDADVHQILQPNTDPHDYEARPADVRATASADVVLLNGQNLDAWMGKVVDQSGGHPTVVDLSDPLPDRVAGETSGPEASRYDPHWFHDPANVERAVMEIRDAFAKADPAHTAAYDANAEAYLAKVRTLDTRIRGCIATIPPADRKLVTDHDAFNYYARRYGLRVVGAVIPSQTTQAQASAGDLAKLSTLIKREGVKAVFPEQSLPAKTADSIASQTGASSKYHLYGDALGPKGSRGATYLSMEQANTDAIVRGLTGGARGCP